MKAKIFQIDSARDVDGPGIRALVGYCGCPLNCVYCINKEALSSDVGKWYTPESLMKAIERDDMYFQATGGGVTFGGGEPALQSQFIARFREICPPEWTFAIETSLNIPRKHVETLIGVMDYWYIDIKDMDPEIYERYTGKGNRLVKKNLQFLSKQKEKGKVIVRVPLIANYNDLCNEGNSIKELKLLNIRDIELFEYTMSRQKRLHQMEVLMGSLVAPGENSQTDHETEIEKEQQ